MGIMKYKNYEGTAEVDPESQVCFGKILFINDLIVYEGDDPKQLYQAFCDAVDEYLETCKTVGKKPEKILKGAFNVRIPPDLHRNAVRKSVQLQTSLNDVVVKALEAYIYGNSNVNHVTNYFVQSGRPQYLNLDVSPTSPQKWVNTLSSTKGVSHGN